MTGKVLVAYATRTGATAGIAEVIGDELRRRGHEVDVRDVAQVGDIGEYHVLILGSELYARRWRRSAVRFLRRHADELRRRQVWLFHSGPLGPDKDTAQAMPGNVGRLVRRIGATPPVTFAADFRDWDRVRNWAHALHDAIVAVEVSAWSRDQWRRPVQPAGTNRPRLRGL